MKLKRIIAWIGIIILVSLYATTLVSACIKWKYATNLFWASIYCSVIIPIIMHIVLRLHEHVVKNREDIIEEASKEGKDE